MERICWQKKNEKGFVTDRWGFAFLNNLTSDTKFQFVQILKMMLKHACKNSILSKKFAYKLLPEYTVFVYKPLLIELFLPI